MAAESLEKAAAEMGVTVKVETQGSGGAKNVLTAEEIATCKGIIIAADKNVELARFDGKPVYSTNRVRRHQRARELIKIDAGRRRRRLSAQARRARSASCGGRRATSHLAARSTST